jgi:integrase
VSGLRIGRSGAKESEPVKPVPHAFIDAALQHVPPTVAALINLQLLTAVRPGELLIMRTCDLDTSGKIWTYTPASHKNTHRGHRRTICLGPQAQAVVHTFLKTDLQAFMLSPRESVAELRLERHAKRKWPQSYCNRPGTNCIRRKAKRSARLVDCNLRQADSQLSPRLVQSIFILVRRHRLFRRADLLSNVAELLICLDRGYKFGGSLLLKT